MSDEKLHFIPTSLAAASLLAKDKQQEAARAIAGERVKSILMLINDVRRGPHGYTNEATTFARLLTSQHTEQDLEAALRQVLETACTHFAHVPGSIREILTERTEWASNTIAGNWDICRAGRFHREYHLNNIALKYAVFPGPHVTGVGPGICLMGAVASLAAIEQWGNESNGVMDE